VSYELGKSEAGESHQRHFLLLEYLARCPLLGSHRITVSTHAETEIITIYESTSLMSIERSLRRLDWGVETTNFASDYTNSLTREPQAKVSSTGDIY
jgi:hypothetical protein